MLERGMALDDHHETLAVSALDGEPDLNLKMPSETYVPVLLTVCLSGFFYGLIALPWWLVIQRHRGDRQRSLLALAAARDREREEAAHG